MIGWLLAHRDRIGVLMLAGGGVVAWLTVVVR